MASASSASSSDLTSKAAVVSSLLGDWCSKTPSDYPKTLASIDLILTEQAINWNSHKIQITVKWSPSDRATGISVKKHKSSAHRARESCLKKLEKKINHIYHKHH